MQYAYHHYLLPFQEKKCSMDIETIYDEEQILNVFASMVKDGLIYLGA